MTYCHRDFIKMALKKKKNDNSPKGYFTPSMKQHKEKLVSKEEYFHCDVVRKIHEPYHYHTHWHDFMELIFIRKGYLRTTLWNTKHTVHEGELLVVMPGELHSTEFDGEKILEFIIIQVDSIVLKNVILGSKEFSMIYPYLYSYWPSRSFVCNYKEVKETRVLSLINNIFSELQKKDLGYSLVVQANMLEIFTWLLRRRDSIVLESEAGNFSIYMKMQPAFDFIKEQYRKKLTTREIADKMAMSIPHFCRLFKKLTGFSFHNYLRFLRIVEAIKLLLSTDKSIKKIASMVGYEDINYFIRAFKSQTGIPPYQYRKKHIPEDNR